MLCICGVLLWLEFLLYKTIIFFVSIVKYNYYAKAHKEVSAEASVAALILRAAQGVRGEAGGRLWGCEEVCSQYQTGENRPPYKFTSTTSLIPDICTES